MSLVIGTQAYTWMQYCEAKGEKFAEHLDSVLSQVEEAGLTAWEGSITSPTEAARMAGLAARHHLKVPTMYVGAKLYSNWREGAEEVVRQASLAKPLGTEIVVCNPDPIEWGSMKDKSDAELREQAKALAWIAGRLKGLDMTLAYHTHDAELRASARELHHMLIATKDAGVGFCLDTHWIYRGAGNSNVALLDIVRLYAERIVSLHLRQSHGGIWCEQLESGDVDLQGVAGLLKEAGFSGPIILETCSETGTVHTVSAIEAHRRSRVWTERLFG